MKIDYASYYRSQVPDDAPYDQVRIRKLLDEMRARIRRLKVKEAHLDEMREAITNREIVPKENAWGGFVWVEARREIIAK